MLTIFSAFAFLASGILANKVILRALPPLFFVGVRMLPAGLIIMALNRKTYQAHGWKRIWHDITPLLFIALCTTFVPSFLKAYALKNMPSAKATLLGCIDPFITAFYVYLLWGERLTLRKITGILIGFSGILILLTSTTPLEETLKAWSIFSLPELAALAAVIASRYGWIMVQKMVREERYSPIEINGIVMVISGIAAIATALASGKAYISTTDNLGITAISLLYTIIGGNIIGYTLYTKALKAHSATLVSLSGFSIPIFVSLGGYLLLGEAITWYTISSGALLFAGITIFHTGRKNIPKIQN